MANSKHLALCAAVATAIASVAGGRVRQDRAFKLAGDVSSQVHVNFRRTTPEQVVMYMDHPRDWVTDIDIAVLARKTGGDEAAVVVDAIWVEIYGLVMADASLGGLADYLEPGDVDVSPDEADNSVCRLDWRITVRHRTDNLSIAS
jgi:hypothetical protein